MSEETEHFLAKLTVEMAALPEEAREWARRVDPQVSVTCDGDTLVIRVDARDQGVTIEQRIDVSEAVTLAMFRYVALAVTELIETGRERGGTAPVTPPVATVSEKIKEDQGAVTVEEEKRSLQLQMVAAPGVWLGEVPTWISFGGGLGLEIGVSSWLVPTIDMEAHYGRDKAEAGIVSAILVSGAAFLLFRLTVEPVSLMVGPGFRMGAVVFEGHPRSSDVTTAGARSLPWNGPCANARGTILVTGGLELGLFAEVGWYTYEAKAMVDKVVRMSLEGPWVQVGVIGKIKLN